MAQPWPGARHPAVATRAILATEDRFFPAPFMRRQIRDRVGGEPIEIEGGHYGQSTHPDAVAAALLAVPGEIAAARDGSAQRGPSAASRSQGGYELP